MRLGGGWLLHTDAVHNFLAFVDRVLVALVFGVGERVFSRQRIPFLDNQMFSLLSHLRGALAYDLQALALGRSSQRLLAKV